MKFNEVVTSISNLITLKRLCSQYVIDYRNLSKDELEKALIKTAPQYYNLSNLEKVYNGIMFHNNRNVRILTSIILKDILLNKPSFIISQKELNDEIIKFEQEIINYSNEGYLKKLSYNEEAIDLFRFVLSVAWEYNDKISPDERNLILKFKNKLNISFREYYIIEAELGKFPKQNNLTHTHDEINEARRELQTQGLIFSFKSKNVEYDVIPQEMVQTYRILFGLEITKGGYLELVNNINIRKKSFYVDTLKKSGLKFDENAKVIELQEFIVENIKPSVLIGGTTVRSGLSSEVLSKWCRELKITCSGSKQDLINRIIEYYDGIKLNNAIKDDGRELYFQYYEELASRNLHVLRKQNIITKDIECERRFEEATNYIFEKLLNHTPLNMAGNENPDGALSYGNKLILWDNKSKEEDINLADHIKQFDRYILQSKKDVASFIVIAPSFTPNSSEECIKYQLLSDTVITLLTAKELKTMAENWKTNNPDTPFPLGYFKQPGNFNINLIKQ